MSKAEPATEPTPQSQAERRTAEANVAAIVAKHAPAHARLIAAARRVLRARMPTAVEMVYEYRAWLVTSFSPSGKGHEGVLAIRADADGVRLYFNQGKILSDPKKILRGSGSLVRFIPLERAPTLKHPEVEALIEEAIARNRVPFAAPSTRPGPVVIRSAPAKQGATPARKGKATRKKSAPKSSRNSG